MWHEAILHTLLPFSLGRLRVYVLHAGLTGALGQALGEDFGKA
ncbi:MAG: hypothetical protein P8163_14270 [Candidatus Thiodiazotropha sp.]